MRPRLLLPVALVLLSACRTKGSNIGTTRVEQDPTTPTWDLVLTLAEPTTTAGQPVGYGVVLVSTAGETVEVVERVSSDLEPSLQEDTESLTPTVAGTHTLSAATEYEGQEYTTTASLDVIAGAPDRVDLALSDLSVFAGSSIDFSVSAWDAWDNGVDASGASVEADSADVSVGTSSLTSTVPGTYTATATLGDASDAEVFIFTPGTAASVTLTLSDTDLEQYETSHAQVTVLDEYGNPTTDPWTLSVDGTGVTTISYSNITFWEEGIYTVRVDVDDTSLWDEVGPLTIDSTGPDLTIDDPERGDWVWGESGTVSGSVSDDWTGVDSLTVNGDDVTVEADGSFSQDVDYDFGMNIVETEATDGDGNTSDDTRALLAGDFLPYGDGVGGGMLARLHEGSGGLGELEAIGEDLITATDLDALIPSPVYSNSSESCYTVLWWEVCVTWYSVDLYVTNPSIGSTDLSIDPLASGLIDTTFTLYDPSLDWSASGTVVGISYSGSGDITADDITVQADLDAYVTSGQIHVDVDSTDVSTTGFDFTMDSWLYDVLDFFGVPIDDWIASYMESAIEDAVQTEIPALVEDSLQDLEIGYTFPVGDNSYDFDAIPYDIDVDDSGITLALESWFTAASWEISRTGEGSLYADYGEPVWTGSPGTILGISGDFLNQAFLAFWGGGLLNMEMTDEDLGLNVEDLAVFLPDLTDLTVTTDALLPPVVIPGTSGSLWQLQLGDLELTLYNGPAESGYEMIQVYVSALIDLDLSVSSDGTLVPALGDMDLYFDVTYPEANTMGASDTEALLEALVPLLLPSLTDALGEIPIPDMQGFTLTGITVGQEGPEDGYTTLGGDLTSD